MDSVSVFNTSRANSFSTFLNSVNTLHTQMQEYDIPGRVVFMPIRKRDVLEFLTNNIEYAKQPEAHDAVILLEQRVKELTSDPDPERTQVIRAIITPILHPIERLP